jgi:hypothetical protein
MPEGKVLLTFSHRWRFGSELGLGVPVRGNALSTWAVSGPRGIQHLEWSKQEFQG